MGRRSSTGINVENWNLLKHLGPFLKTWGVEKTCGFFGEGILGVETEW